MLTESLEKIKQESFEQGIEQGIKKGIKQGELTDKQNILIKLLSKKYGLEENEKEYIKSITDVKKLDTAIEETLFADDKNQVLDCLK